MMVAQGINKNITRHVTFFKRIQIDPAIARETTKPNVDNHHSQPPEIRTPTPAIGSSTGTIVTPASNLEEAEPEQDRTFEPARMPVEQGTENTTIRTQRLESTPIRITRPARTRQAPLRYRDENYEYE